MKRKTGTFLNKLMAVIMVYILFAILLCGVYLIHSYFFTVEVVLYDTILDVLIASGAVALFLFTLRVLSLFTGFEKTLIIFTCILSGYAFAITIPTVIDRSLSMYILEKIQQRGGGILQDKIEDVFTKEYLFEHRLMDVRLTEQLESGTIVIEGGCVKLTGWGDAVASFGVFFRQNLLPKKRLLMGEYTDDLTNPFRNSIDVNDYKCE